MMLPLLPYSGFVHCRRGLAYRFFPLKLLPLKLSSSSSSSSLLPPSSRLFAAMSSPPQEGGEGDYCMFGPYKIGVGEIFLTTPHSFAFVNLRPVVPGHVLVCSKRVVPRFLDLTDEETTDLWITAKRVGAKLEPHYGGSSLTFGIQDGIYAGQTVPHVHIHILPRKAEDFQINDEVYDEMDRKERELKKRLDAEAARKDRDIEEMAAEASELRKLF
eukprot:c17451_g1_i1 orf=175-822(+)